MELYLKYITYIITFHKQKYIITLSAGFTSSGALCIFMIWGHPYDTALNAAEGHISIEDGGIGRGEGSPPPKIFLDNFT